jgi:hypothetical protein
MYAYIYMVSAAKHDRFFIDFCPATEAAWTWTCNTDINMRHGHGHAAWTWTCSMDMGMQHGHVHMQRIHVNDAQHGH